MPKGYAKNIMSMMFSRKYFSKVLEMALKGLGDEDYIFKEQLKHIIECCNNSNLITVEFRNVTDKSSDNLKDRVKYINKLHYVDVMHSYITDKIGDSNG